MDVGLDPFPGSMASSAAAAAAIKEVEERERGGKKGVKGRVGLHGWSMVKEPKTDTVVDEPSHTRAVSSFCHADLTVTSSSNCSMTPSPSPSPPLYPPPSSSNPPPPPPSPRWGYCSRTFLLFKSPGLSLFDCVSPIYASIKHQNNYFKQRWWSAPIKTGP